MKYTDYNGWRNRQTWNCALWISNDETLYRAALAYMTRRAAAGKRSSDLGFRRAEGLSGTRTPDGIAWDGTRLDLRALTERMRELA